MIKLSVSQAARRLGISRREIQQQINNGTLHTHEGYVTTDSIRLAYPKSNLYSEQDKKIKRYEQIQKDAVYKSAASAQHPRGIKKPLRIKGLCASEVVGGEGFEPPTPAV